MEISKELLELVSKSKTAEDLLKKAKEKGFNIDLEEAKKLFDEKVKPALKDVDLSKVDLKKAGDVLGGILGKK